MNGCHWCNLFLPQWNIINDKINNNDLKYIKTYEFDENQKDINERALKIQKHIKVEGFPTIIVKINDKYYKYEKKEDTPNTDYRTVYDILKFIKSKLIENEIIKKDLIDYFDEKINQYQLEIPKQTGGYVDYQKKYHKYKDMYNSLLKKYNKIK